MIMCKKVVLSMDHSFGIRHYENKYFVQLYLLLI